MREQPSVKRIRVSFCVLSFFFLVLGVGNVTADPILRNLLIQGGFALGNSSLEVVAWDLEGDGVLFPRLSEPGFLGPSGPYLPGESIFASSVIAGGTDVNSMGNELWVDGHRFGPPDRNIGIGGQLAFHAGYVTAPDFGDEDTVVLEAPFTLAYSAFGDGGGPALLLVDDLSTGEPLFQFHLFGKGLVKIPLLQDRTPGFWEVDVENVRYEILPVPEPGTLLLLAGGVLAILSLRLSLRRYRAPH